MIRWFLLRISSLPPLAASLHVACLLSAQDGRQQSVQTQKAWLGIWDSSGSSRRGGVQLRAVAHSEFGTAQQANLPGKLLQTPGLRNRQQVDSPLAQGYVDTFPSLRLSGGPFRATITHSHLFSLLCPVKRKSRILGPSGEEVLRGIGLLFVRITLGRVWILVSPNLFVFNQAAHTSPSGIPN